MFRAILHQSRRERLQSIAETEGIKRLSHNQRSTDADPNVFVVPIPTTTRHHGRTCHLIILSRVCVSRSLAFRRTLAPTTFIKTSFCHDLYGMMRGSDDSKDCAIEEAVAANDAWKLRELALEDGGFLNGTCCVVVFVIAAPAPFIRLKQSQIVLDSLRRLAWPLLLLPPPIDELISWEFSLSDQDRRAVQWDVDRCAMTLEEKQVLVNVIEQSCRYYYQGYHQIAAHVLRLWDQNPQPTIHMLRRLYLSHLGHYVGPNDLPVVRLVQLMGPPMLYHMDMDLYQVMGDDSYTFSIGSILTWFVASDQADRLFDAFIASHPLLPLYLSLAILLQHKPIILDEPMNVHKILCCVNDSSDMNIEALLDRAIQLMGRIPPNQRLWLLASHYYGDGAVEDLLCTAVSNALLRLVAPESITTFTARRSSITSTATTSIINFATTFPRAFLAAGLARPPLSMFLCTPYSD
jgi:hypothetical protein